MPRRTRKIPAIGGEALAFLHRMDSVEGEAMIATTDRGRLRTASFLDGREIFWDETRLTPLDLSRPQMNPARLAMFHVGFCGSTLLARMLDRPGRVLVLKEPQCLADIAGQHHAIAAGNAVAPLDTLLDHALGQMGAAGEPLVRIVIKPTNWVNLLLPSLCAPGRIERAVFVTMDPRAYLGAVFRGGRERIAFCSRLAAAMAPVVSAGQQLLADAIAGADDPLERAARIVALLHAMQEHLFDRAITANNWPRDARIDFAHLAQHPAVVLRRARARLGLEAAPDEHEDAVAMMDRHAKDPASPFRPNRRLQEDAAVETHHAARFDAALDWMASRSTDLA